MQDVNTITTERPKVKRVYVVARDPDSGKSRSTTIYNASPDDVVSAIEGLASREDAKPKSRRSA